MAYLFRNISVLLLEIHIFKSFALSFVSLGEGTARDVFSHTSIGLNGLAIRPNVEE